MTNLAELDPFPYPLNSKEWSSLLSPALIIDLDRVRGNLRQMQADLGGDFNRWRPHLKTSKIPAVYAELLRAGVRQFKCATTREAAVFLEVVRQESMSGIDLLVAYPHVQPAISRLQHLAVEYPEVRLSVLCEDPALVAAITPHLSIFIDLNPGMNRTGIPLSEFSQAEAIAKLAGESFRGLHYYDGHHHSGPAAERRAAAHRDYARLLERLQDTGTSIPDVEELITSGTPTFSHALAYEPFQEGPFLHRVSPGTIVYSDTLVSALDELSFLPAAMVLTRIISHPTDRLATCDAGSKSIAAEAGHPCAFVLGHPHFVPQKPSEEHLPLSITTGPRPPRGTPLLLIPKHVCPTVNLAEQAVLLENGKIREVVPVSARAHELIRVSVQ